MNDIIRALATAAGILSPVVLLIVIVSIVAVKRGEALMAGHGPEATPTAEPAAPSAAAKTGKAAVAVEEINVGQILLYGVGLFTLTILGLLGLSIIEHMN
jgi:hypothetical protein